MVAAWTDDQKPGRRTTSPWQGAGSCCWTLVRTTHRSPTRYVGRAARTLPA